jgi:arginyl-tRNA synthetase
MEELRQGNHLTVREGATWFASTDLGEDKDNVLVRGSGAPTYFATDLAYHYNKFRERGFSKVINIWGADHQGHVSRMKAAIGALGIDPNRLTIIIHQLVTLKSGDQVLRASKRTGDIITLQDLLEEVGPDACRYFFLARSPESQMEFDLDLAKNKSSENPVYYIQYAHARIASILRLAQDSNIDYRDGDVSLLTDPAELSLIRRMVMLPELIESMAISLEPHHLPHYAQDLATAFHWFYQQCRVVSSTPGDEAITRARLKLVKASTVALGRCLHLMGMDAPEKM